MRLKKEYLGAALLCLLSLFDPASARGSSKPSLRLKLLATFDSPPISLSNAGDGSDRLFVLLKPGTIQIYSGGEVLPVPFLDIQDRVSSQALEEGLLGLAFHPDYANNGRFYVFYSDLAGDAVISRFNVSPTDPNVADPNSESVVLRINHLDVEHYGGSLHFGPDGYLYIPKGDGSPQGDPQNVAQDLGKLLGKILRIDVDSGEPYAIPPTNPFIGVPGALPEIWAYGFRNPWRVSFDRSKGDLYIGDVGFNFWEEVDFQPASSPGGENYGWRLMEGKHCFRPAMDCNDGTLTLPFFEYPHTDDEGEFIGCAVIGGYVYRGSRNPLLNGIYFFSDWCSGRIWGASENENGERRVAQLRDSNLTVTSFGEDEAGEIYLVETNDNGLYQILDSRPFCDVELEKHAYGNGETVTASVRRLVNLRGMDATVRLRVAVTRPSDPPFLLLDKGSDGSFQIKAGEDRDLGPHEIFTVKPQMPRGSYTFSCLLTDPFTGAELARDDSPFQIQ